MAHTARSLEIARTVSNRRMLRVARELGVVSPSAPTPEGARHLRDALERLGTTFVKLGQLLSTRPDLVGELYVQQLTSLQDQLQPVPWEQVRRVVEASLGTPIETSFASFDEQPLASASIAQVHGAVLHGGERVVVKVRRPGIVEEIQRDLEILDRLVARAEPHVDPNGLLQLRTVVDELTWSLGREVDLQADAANLRQVAASLEGFEDVVVPRVHDQLVREDVLVMERIDGVKATAALLEPERASHLASELLRAYVRQVLIDGVYHADPHAGNVLVTSDGRLALIDFGLVGRLDHNTRIEFALLLLAMSENRADDAADLLVRMSTTTRDTKVLEFRQELRRLLPRYVDSPLGTINVGMAIMRVQSVALRCRLGLPVPFALVGKALAQVDSIARRLDPGVDPLATLREHVSTVLWAELADHSSPSAMLAMLGGPALSLMRMPRQVEHLVERLQQGEVTVSVSPSGIEGLVDETRTVVNRLGACIVVSAIVIASALLMNVRGVGLIAGYPALGFIGFVVASAIGLVIVVRMLRSPGGI